MNKNESRKEQKWKGWDGSWGFVSLAFVISFLNRGITLRCAFLGWYHEYPELSCLHKTPMPNLFHIEFAGISAYGYLVGSMCVWRFFSVWNSHNIECLQKDPRETSPLNSNLSQLGLKWRRVCFFLVDNSFILLVNGCYYLSHGENRGGGN